MSAAPFHRVWRLKYVKVGEMIERARATFRIVCLHTYELFQSVASVIVALPQGVCVTHDPEHERVQIDPAGGHGTGSTVIVHFVTSLPDGSITVEYPSASIASRILLRHLKSTSPNIPSTSLL